MLVSVVECVVGAWLMRGCAFAGARACRRRCRMFHVNNARVVTGSNLDLGGCAGGAWCCFCCLWCEWWSNEVWSGCFT